MLAISCAALVFSLCARLYCTGTMAAKNADLTDVLSQKTSLEKELISLRYEQSRLDSLSYIEGNAKRLGFIAMQGSLTPIDISGASLAAVTTQ